MTREIKIFVVVAWAAFLVGGCAGVSTRTPSVRPNEAFLKELCDNSGIYWQWDPVSQVARLEYRGAVAEALLDSDLVIIGKNRITLSRPVRMERSVVIVPADFQSKVIDRLKQAADKEPVFGLSLIRKIIIDAGHGGKDPGAIGRDGVYEKDVVLDIAKRISRILERRGFDVKMTRATDEFISLQERTQIASRFGADLFVSVHANSNPVRSVQGIEVYTARHLGFQERAEDQRVINQQILFDGLAMKKGSRDVENIVADLLYTRKQNEAKLLAERLAEDVSATAKMVNRGEFESRFFVLRNTLIPAVLVEVGYLTNPREAKQLQSDEYRQKIALGLAESIIKYADDQ